MIELFIILFGFISLIIIGIWYDKIVPPIHSLTSRIFPSNPAKIKKKASDSISESTIKKTEYPRIEDIEYAKPVKMTIYHLLFLITGAAFWGILISLVGKIFIWPDISMSFLFGVCIILTCIVTLFVQERCGGFDIEKPQHWFFIPIGSWVLVLLWACVEALFFGEASICDFFH